MKHWFMILSLLAVVQMSCTEADLCPESLDEHPHGTFVCYNFNWPQDDEFTPPDSMYILAYRVINMWKSTVAVSSHGNPVKGHYIYNEFVSDKDKAAEETQSEEENTEEQGTDEETDTEEQGAETGTVAETEPAGTRAEDTPVQDIEYFNLKSGYYKFVTFNRKDSEIDYSPVDYYMQHDESPISDLNVIYKTYRKDNPDLRFTIPDWVDYNAYGDPDRYMQPSVQPIYYDTIPVQYLRPNKLLPDKVNKVNSVGFPNPRKLTQHIDIEFDIKKASGTAPFTVDSVFAEISGIPYIINLASGHIDITKTKKMMFKTVFVKDTETNTLIHCKGSIDVPTIVESTSDDLFMGPGIMQVMIMCTATDTQTGEELHKTFQGSINLYHTLKKAGLIKWSEDRKTVKKNKESATLVIQAEMLVDGENIIDNPDDNAGLDVWRKEEKPNIVDI